MVAAAALVRLALFLREPLAQQIGVIPDDAFYYLVAAKHFARTATWTFDGVAPASGFHLLHAYLLAALYKAAPDLGVTATFAAVDGAATALLVGAAWFAARAVARDAGAGGWLGVVLAFTAPLALQQQTFMVESPLVIFFSCALLDRISAGRGSWAWAFALGLGANLARSDFGLLPAACAVTLALLGRRQAAAVAAAATAGAAAGLALLVLHSLGFSGSFIQSSARVKSRWSELLGYDWRGYVRVLLDFLAPRDLSWLRVLSLPVLVLGAGLFGLFGRLRVGTLRAEWLPLALACAATVLAYTLFYGRTSAGVPPWYLAHALAPAAYVMGALTSQIQRRGQLAAAAVAAAAVAGGVKSSLSPIWPHQPVMVAAGEYLRAHPEVAPVGAWNAGMISYFSGREVTNLDGLINDDIYPFATTEHLLEYLCARHIAYLMDFSEMLDDPYLRTRGGYADGRLQAALHEEANLSRGDPALRWTDSDMKLWRLDAHACAAQ